MPCWWRFNRGMDQRHHSFSVKVKNLQRASDAQGKPISVIIGMMPEKISGLARGESPAAVIREYGVGVDLSQRQVYFLGAKSELTTNKVLDFNEDGLDVVWEVKGESDVYDESGGR